MRAYVNHRYGGTEVLELQETTKPTPKPGEVLVSLSASSINSWDWDYLRGRPYAYRLVFGLFRPRVRVLGADIAGTVEKVGNQVDRFQPGDRVFGDVSAYHWGGFGDYVCVKEKLLAKIPPVVGFEVAAASPQAGLLAFQALNKYGPVKRGQRILINGAGGGVGTFAIQLAKMEGAEVIAVDHSHKLSSLTALGADRVMDCKSTDFTQNKGAYDLILENVAGKSVYAYRRALARGGRFVFIGGQLLPLLQVLFMGTWIGRDEDKLFGILQHKANAEDLETFAGLLASGKIRAEIDTTFPLEKLKGAFRHYEDGQFVGKIVIKH